MRAFPLAALASLALVALAAPAAASHMGPCTHEYFDAAIYAVQHIKTGGISVFVQTAVACASNLGDGLGLEETILLP